MRNETAAISANLHGDKLYQLRARHALPLLVRQALAGTPIFYQQLAVEMGMPNPRNLNFVLGSVGQSLIHLEKEWNETIPPIQCLVINQSNQLPGEGFGWFLENGSEWKGLSKRQKATVTHAVMQKIYAYPKWPAVLKALELVPVPPNYTDLLDRASNGGMGGGESEEHRVLKEYVQRQPQLVGLSMRYGPGVVEKKIPSGDRLDVFFESDDEWIGVEVKSSISDESDLVRGIFQCVKYKAVLNALSICEQRDVNVRTVLVLQGTLPPHLIPLKHMLGVEVIQAVDPRS
ncbi:hypothetical protein GTP91_18645 [Rugamonas sp. FT82W]|uniref:Uncharacterized protein n=1 Tax=Duganella vulcania TaxID=2692166 RepID=A0A845G3H3_9BURK|nr:hypothetical protein [Duganella vulcania]MYM89183.1 hypothetical protein [Duganella vulcania]